ncbi:unnamed protein product [Absidia cylindrospora]
MPLARAILTNLCNKKLTPFLRHHHKTVPASVDLLPTQGFLMPLARAILSAPNQKTSNSIPVQPQRDVNCSSCGAPGHMTANHHT